MSEQQNIQLSKEQQKQALRTFGRRMFYVLLSLPFVFVFWELVPTRSQLASYLGDFWSWVIWVFIFTFTSIALSRLLIDWDDSIPSTQQKRGAKYWGLAVALSVVMLGGSYVGYLLHEGTEQEKVFIEIFRYLLGFFPGYILGSNLASSLRRRWKKLP
jgi:hypothetical protein